MSTRDIFARAADVAVEAFRPLHEVQEAHKVQSRVNPSAVVDGIPAFDRISAFLLAQGLNEIDRSNANLFDNRAHAVALTYPSRAHEVTAVLDLVGELQPERAAALGHELLDIIVE